MVDFFLRKSDPLAPVYEVDFEAGTWKMAASRVGIESSVGGDMADGGERFRSDAFEQVWQKIDHGNGVVTYTKDKPVTDLTDEELQAEFEGFMWADAVGEFKITAEQTERHRAIEREMKRREASAAQP